MAAKIVQTTGNIDHNIIKSCLEIPIDILQYPATFNATNYMLYRDTDARNGSMGLFFSIAELPSSRLFLGLINRHTRHLQTLIAQISIHVTAYRTTSSIFVADALIMNSSFTGITQILDLSIR